jgi:uncharacterized lipoprotein
MTNWRFGAALALLLCVAAPAEAGLFGEVPPDPVDYAPGSALSARGTLSVGSFDYLPSTAGKLKPNEIKVDGLRPNRHISQDVGKFFRESLLKELRFTGIKIADGGAVLSGEIKAFDDNHVNQQTTDLTVHYVLKSAAGAVLYDGEKSSQQFYKGGHLFGINAPLLANFEELLRDPAFQNALDPTFVPPVIARRIVSFLYGFNSAPTTAFIAGGAVRIGAFDYLPPAGGKIAPDVIRNTAIGEMKLDQPVADFVAQALIKQFRLAGVALDKGDLTLTGTVVDIAADDLGYSSDWKADIKYVVKDRAGKIVYQGEKVTKETTSKAFQLNRILRHNFEALLLDDAFLKAIGAPTGMPNSAEPVIPYDSYDGFANTEYAPRTALSVQGAVEVGPVAYLPAGKKVKENEIPCTTLMAKIFADKNIALLFHDLALNEFRTAGIDVRPGSKVLTTEIQKYKVDNTEHPPEWVVAMRFTVKDKTGATLYDAVKSATPLGVDVANWTNFSEMEVMIEQLLTDPAFVRAIN